MAGHARTGVWHRLLATGGTPAAVATLLVSGLLWAGEGSAGGGEPAVSLAEAPANTWVLALEEKTGGREQPLFVYLPTLKKFVMAAGMQATGGIVPRHYDTEELDFAALKWVNAYPPVVAAGRPESGPLEEAYSRARAMMGNMGPELFYKDGENLRLGAGGQWLGTRTTYEWTCVPESGKVYLYIQDKTLCYDAAQRTWQDLGARPLPVCRVWASMCWDPVNQEIFHAGGGGGSADVSTWVFSPEKNEWRKLDFGSAAMKALGEKARALCWRAKALLGAVCNRFDITETEAEARADLTKMAADLAAGAEKLAAEVPAAGLEGAEKEAGEVAVRRLTSAAVAVKAVGPKLAGKITPELIGEVRAARVLFERVVDALAVEPPGRARSQVAYDPVHKKIVLFGGDGLDRTLSDTWVYDCATRTWEQRFPARCPTPRAGHILAWLPKAQRIVLAGGYSRIPLAQEIWTYDVAANEWSLLLHVPLKPEDYGRAAFSPNAPRVTARETQVGAVTDDDVLVCVTAVQRRRLTWALKVDPSKTDAAATAEHAGTSGAYTWNRIDPADWEKVANPDPEKTAEFLKAMPVNQWTSLPFPRYAPGATNRWGTTAYDTDRHQLLFWGGGHATSHENDVAHYSVRGGCWTIGYHPDDPIETVYASQPTPLSFQDRAHVPVHAYRAYCYDPALGKMVYFDRAYDPAVREWEPKPLTGLEHRGVMYSYLAPTPKGAVCYSERGLFRVDAAAGQWRKLPWNGPAFGRIWCDGHGLRYDSRRDCLWLANDKDVFRYDLAAGTAERLAVKKPQALGRFIFWSEEVYLPDADLILLMNLFRKPDGTLSNIAWSPAENKFYWVALPFVENDKPVAFKGPPFSWHDALLYDPHLKLVLLNNSSARKVWALKFDRASAAMEPIVDEE